MVTLDKIRIYNKFQGDIDAWARLGSKKEKSIMNDSDWVLIDGLIQSMRMKTKGLASNELLDDLKNRLGENCDCSKTVDHIAKIADNQ